MVNCASKELAKDSNCVSTTSNACSPWFVLFVGTLLVIEAVWLFAGQINHDVAWYFDVAERIYDGDRLYHDVILINPPLIVWINWIVVWLDRNFMGVGLNVLFFVFAGLIAISLWLFQLVVSHYPGATTSRTQSLVLVAVLTVAVIPIKDFGQREAV